MLSRFFAITPSLPPIYFPVVADSLTDSRSAGFGASVSWRQWQRMQAITIPCQRLPLCLEILCGWFQGTLTPPRTSALLEQHYKRDTFWNLPSDVPTLLLKQRGWKSHSDAALCEPADDFHWFRNRLGQRRMWESEVIEHYKDALWSFLLPTTWVKGEIFQIFLVNNLNTYTDGKDLLVSLPFTAVAPWSLTVLFQGIVSRNQKP